MASHSKRFGIYSAYDMQCPGDNIRSIVYKQYGIAPQDSKLYPPLRDYLLFLNPTQRNDAQGFGNQMPKTLNFIAPNAADLVCKPTEHVKQQIKQLLHTPSGFAQTQGFATHAPTEPGPRAVYELLVRAQADQDYVETINGGGLGALNNLAQKDHKEVLNQLQGLYRQRLEKKISAQQYNNLQKLVIDGFKKRLSFMEHLVYDGRGAYGSLYMNKARGIEVPAKFAAKAKHWAHLANLSKAGGVLLTAHAWYSGCRSIAATSVQAEKNRIAYETVLSIGVGGFATLGVLVVAAPIGIVLGTVVLTGAGAIGGMSGHALGNFLYDRVGKQINITDNRFIQKVCS